MQTSQNYRAHTEFDHGIRNATIPFKSKNVLRPHVVRHLVLALLQKLEWHRHDLMKRILCFGNYVSK